MFLAEPQPTPYDLRFRLLGIPVRVAPWFWLVVALLGWNLTSSGGAQQGLLLLLWIGAAFVSILVHEMGHALAMRFYGIPCSIVLYQFGGLAIPAQYSGGRGLWARRGHSGPVREIVITAAGPATQLALAVAVAGVLRVSGYGLRYPVPYLEAVLSLGDGRLIASPPVDFAIFCLLLASVLWALLNLLPVYPLDGGQIMRNVLTLFNPGTGIRNSLILSVIVGAGVAAYAFSQQDPFLGLMFGMLAFSSFQTLQAYSGRGGYGPW